MVLNAFGEKLTLKDVPPPKPGLDEVIVRVKAVGLCGSDLKITGGKIKTTPLPHIPGHEIAGIVTDCGGGVPAELSGKRVIIHTYQSCGVCEACVDGAFNMCASLQGRIGFELPGGLGEFVRTKSKNLVILPENISYTDACIIPCAMLSIFHALNRAQIVPSDKVAILGVGGLGIHGVQFLANIKLPVTAVDIKSEKLAFAKQLGASSVPDYESFVNSRELYSVIFDNVAKPDATRACLKKLGKNGRYVMVAYSPGVESVFDSEYMHLNETRIIGTRNGTIPELKEIVKLVSEGRVKPVVDQVLSVKKANEALDMVRQGLTMGRVVLSHEDR
jgi:D-arabinose 1-dehydrogenase-like Zn-dependent alcohol dehydrogenase